MSKEILVIGSGQCGISVLSEYKKSYDLSNYLYFNSAKDNGSLSGVNYLKANHVDLEGSGRNPRVTLEKIIPGNEEMIKEKVSAKIESGKTKQVVLISSAGGGTGAILNWWIIKNILLDLREKMGLKIYVALVFGFQSEKNPVVGNGAIQITNFYYPLMNEISVVPFMNDEIFVEGGSRTYQKTNDHICDVINKIIDFNSFAGKTKENGFNTLDKNEFFRMTQPDNGFISYRRIDLQDIELIENENFVFDIKKSKSLIVMYRTSQNRSINKDVIDQLANIFPFQKRIVAESLSVNGRNYIEIIGAGIPIPEYFLEMRESMKEIEFLKKKEEKDISANKKKVEKIVKKTSEKNKTKLFDF